MASITYSIKRAVFLKMKAAMIGYFKQKSAEVPKFELDKRHIANLKVLLDREELLELMPKNGVVAELGVNKGEFSEKILSICQPQKLHLVDIWGSERYNQDIRKSVEKKFEKEISAGKVEINLGLSSDVVEKFSDNYFDWIYVDTDHTYQTTKAELEKYQSKIKPGGIIAGHDYILGNFEGMMKYGVKEAVYEFCKNHDWEIIHLTMENNIPPSFAIRRIS